MPRINTNIQSMVASGALKRNNRAMSKVLEKLSTGNQINRSSDNAAGLSVAERLKAQTHGLEAANRNILDGISVLNIADGALNEIGNMLQRLRELAVQSATATLGDNERNYIQLEVEQLKEEIDRISGTTKFNNMPLLNGDTRTATGHRNPWGDHDDGRGARLHIGAGHDNANDLLEISLPVMTAVRLFGENDGSGNWNTRHRDEDGRPLIIRDADDDPVLDDNGDEQQIYLDLRSVELARQAIGILDDALTTINGARSQIGARTNRLEHALTNQKNMHTDVSSAESLIRHTDFSVEAMHMTRMQVLQQSSTAILAQANALPNNILGLLNI